MGNAPLSAEEKAVKERVRIGTKHKYTVLKKLEDSGRTYALAQGRQGVALLPDDVRLAGFAALDALGAKLCAAFPNGGEGESLDNSDMAGFFELLKMEELHDELRPRLTLRDAAAHVREVVRLLKMNPVLVVAAAEYATLLPEEHAACYPHLNEPDAQADLRRHVAYSAFLEALALQSLHQPKASNDEERNKLFVATLVDRICNALDTTDWKQYATMFEYLKVKLVRKPVTERVAVKQGLADDETFDQKSGDGLNLQLNILDAMYADVLAGNNDNAECGYELMSHTHDKEPEPLTGEGYTDEWVKADGVRMGVALNHWAFADAWADIYSSWNGAFCTNYPELFYAKLYNPATAGVYLETAPELYLYSRGLDLFVHVAYVMLSRAKAGKAEYGAVNWRNEALRAVWGRVNLVAAGAYHKRVEHALSVEKAKVTKYRVRRAERRAGWLALRTLVKGARLTGEAEAGAVSLFRRFVFTSGVTSDKKAVHEAVDVSDHPNVTDADK